MTAEHGDAMNRSAESPGVAPRSALQVLELSEAAPRPRLTPLMPPPRSSWRSRLAGLALLAGVTAAAPWYAQKIAYSITAGKRQAEVDSARAALTETGLSSALQSRLVAQGVRPSVVRIRTHAAAAAETQTSSGDPHAERSERSPRDGPREYFFNDGEGSGVVVDEEGYIVTNLHVVGQDAELEVLLSDGRRREARTIGVDPLTDLAVIRIDASDLIPAVWGNSRSLAEGDWVWAVGSPFGLDQSITFGIVSAKGRREKAGRPHQDFLQTDAAVNPGNSGGPLVNARGEIVGINTAIVGDAYQGVSFAVPSEIAERVYRQIKRTGRVERGWLGVHMEPAIRGLFTAGAVRDGVGVVQVEARSPAEAAGVQPGDRIVGWGGEPVHTSSDLSVLVAQSEIGSVVDLELIRAEQSVACVVEVGLRPNDP